MNIKCFWSVCLFIFIVNLCARTTLGAKRSKRRGCKYRRSGIKWGECDPILKVKTKFAILRSGSNRCPKTRAYTKPCDTGLIFYNGCEYIQVSEWSECVDESTTSTRTLELRHGDTKFCDNTRVESRDCDAIEEKKDFNLRENEKRRGRKKGQRKKKRRKKNRRKSRKKNRRKNKNKPDGSKLGDCTYQAGVWSECDPSTDLQTTVQTLDPRFNMTQCEKIVVITRKCIFNSEESSDDDSNTTKSKERKERRNRKKKNGKKDKKKKKKKKKYPDLSKKPPRLSELHVVPHTTFVVVTWPPPSPDQFGQEIPVKGYQIGYGRGVPDVFMVEVGPAQFSYKIENLEPGSEYVISIRAQNQMGVGQALYETVITREIDSVKTKALLPPVYVVATVLSPSAINVSWVDLASEGEEGRSRAFYVRYRPLSRAMSSLFNDRFQTLKTNSTHLLVENLLPFTGYEFSVQTTDGLQNSTWSMMVWNKTEEKAPTSPPRDLTVVIDPDSPGTVTLNWQPPKEPNGIITGYELTSSTTALGGRPLVEKTQIEGNKLSVTMTSLVPGWTYDLSVRGQTSKGQGPAVTLKDYQLPEVPAPLPATLRVTAATDNPNAVQLTWDFKDKIPEDIQEYLILSSTEVNWQVEKRVSPDVTTAVIDSLKPDTDYFLKVQARTPLLYGRESNTVLYHTPAAGTTSSPPVEVPRSLQVSILSSSIAVVSWRDVEAVFENSSLPTIRYTVRYRSVDPDVSEYKLVSPPFSSLYLSDLEPLTQYEFQVRMQRGEEVSDWSAPVTGTTSAADFSQHPLKAELKQMPHSPNMVTLTWQPHSTSKIKEYVVLYSTDARKPPKHWLQKAAVNQNVRQQDFYDLDPGTTYHFFIQAMTDLGFGPRSKVVSYSTPNSTKSSAPVLAAVTSLQVRVVSPNAAALHWKDPAVDRKYNGIPATRKYTVRIRDLTHKSSNDQYITAPQSSHYVHDLRPGTEYEFVVKVSQGGRTSLWSEPVIRTMGEAEPGSSPVNLTISMYQRDPTAVLLSWEPPQLANGRITGYEILYKKAKSRQSQSETLSVPGDVLSLKIHDLEPRTPYLFTIRASNSKGFGPIAKGVNYRTPKVLGSSPQDVTVTHSEDNPFNALIAWQPPASATGRRIKSYRISYQTEDGKHRKELSVPADTLNAVIHDLLPSTTYHFRVQAYYKHRAGPQSEVAMYSIPKELLQDPNLAIMPRLNPYIVS